ncbi:hypothetical protein Pmani_031533 [Petrolisthes manimaculis]|uniref:Uncharacterized protein n=1 Tax=Petrolisthes manimaculis TaxID=1843537 RepID=A0AAE1NVQ1_9EUCA|nr:hypothetical protein Pmani_031533 [Petrolisthes manimaculis]
MSLLLYSESTALLGVCGGGGGGLYGLPTLAVHSYPYLTHPLTFVLPIPSPAVSSIGVTQFRDLHSPLHITNLFFPFQPSPTTACSLFHLAILHTLATPHPRYSTPPLHTSTPHLHSTPPLYTSTPPLYTSTLHLHSTPPLHTSTPQIQHHLTFVCNTTPCPSTPPTTPPATPTHIPYSTSPTTTHPSPSQPHSFLSSSPYPFPFPFPICTLQHPPTTTFLSPPTTIPSLPLPHLHSPTPFHNSKPLYRCIFSFPRSFPVFPLPT